MLTQSCQETNVYKVMFKPVLIWQEVKVYLIYGSYGFFYCSYVRIVSFLHTFNETVLNMLYYITSNNWSM